MDEYINVSLVISSSEDHNDLITSKLNILPTKIKNRDEIKILEFAHCEWIYETGNLKVRSVSEASEPMLRIFSDKKSIIKELLNEINGKCDIVIVISADSSDGPEVVLDNKMISFANDIQAEIGFDLYYYDLGRIEE